MSNSRALLIIVVVFFVFGVLIVRLYDIQISKHKYYTLIADRQQNLTRPIKAERGIIKDKNGEVLGFTKDNVSFFADTRMMNNTRIDSVSALFARVFQKNKLYYKNLIKNGDGNTCLERKVPMEQALKIKDAPIDGLFYEDDFTRVYPYGSLASHVIGFVNTNMVGIEGVEKIYNDKLTGTDGKYLIERDVIGRPVSVNDNLSQPPVSGDNITLTINRAYQRILEEELSSGLKKYEAKSAVGIIMNPNTGEVLALVNVPDYDPANYNLFDANARRDRALTDTYEPGSTFKSIVMSILLSKNLVKEDEVINTENGVYKFKNVKIKDTHKFEKLTVKEILEQSSNIGMSKLSQRISDDDLYKSLRDFGFSNPTAIDLPSEASGYLKKPSQYSGLSKAFLSFGYEISVTPIQLISAYAALINGGILYQPYVVKSVSNYRGNILQENNPIKIRQVIPSNISEEMRELMVGVVEEGTGKEARLEDVLVGGKTGTSQILVDNSYSSKEHNSSFVGFFPAKDPKVICFILYNAPEVGKYGGLVSAPVFHNIAKRLVDADINLVPNRKRIQRAGSLINNVIADSKSNESVISFLNPGNNSERQKMEREFNLANRTTMPNLVNKTLRDAVSMLTELGMKYKILGGGKVISQSIEAGSLILRDSVCVLKCETHINITSINLN